MDNVVEFKQKEQLHQETCPHCEVKEDWIFTFLENFQAIIETGESNESMQQGLIELCSDFYDEAFSDGKREGFLDIIGYAGFNVDQIDGVIDDE